MTDTLHSEFIEQAVKNPAAPAVYSDAGVMTYGELDERSRALAERLVTDGAGPGVPVGICVERTPDLLVALLATLRAGSCYVPLDPDYPAERLAFMVRDSGTRLLLTTPASRANCPAGPTVVVLDESVRTEPGERPVPVVPEDTAYIIYTSGSTGRPKGVAIHHPGCVAMLAELDRVFEGCDLSGVSAASSVCFDMSVMEIFGALCRGGAVVLVQSAVHLPESPYADRITHLNAVPSVMNGLLDAGYLPPRVRTIVFGGEPLRRKLVDRAYAETGADRVFNAYGPTEGTVFCSFGLVPRDGAGEPTLGLPSAHARAYVLDEDRRRLPAGVPGELYIGGAGLAHGYVNRPETTAERFLPDPFVDGERMYRTGDVVTLTEDGELRFGGRTDHQVKLRGYRIELEEVEARLTGCPEVREAAAVVRGNRLIGYVVPEGDAGDDVRLDAALQSTVNGRLATELPDYMVPATLVFLPALPLAPGGKLDRAALPEPPAAGADAPMTAASTPTEVALAEIWGQLLDLEPAGIDVKAAFYDLGGDSLLLVRLARLMTRRFGRRVRVPDLFSFRDIASLGRWLDEESGATPEVVTSARRRANTRRAALRGRAASNGS
ncbi:amino acid adenylation domain-containing protein [Streptomyces alfalfae]|uniref:Amino acid adenylation protein n=1 Tax=Streptomyces alfalfae TaxID=1642299 RepID=A0ABM6GLW2_9ACTN|nr:non-ribosomal peptide synthetase [Streptomyces alfalfae]AYA15284.1 amino acid adenylation domain-containing protein [Streptomyces fradiae]APY84950.1 amino acid adenylation protein [Streptomyces alfalfae]RXX34962.1 amino acid adenylation domain-containing protein [Streptomyces alfalfae]RXX45831.1 amino acid adenylation domain-containing protein [Streptomyces alfalfae]RXX47966.1 amino acid adenylation domain-containing protein [Streptomyces alfalfae]